jgi:DNA-binding CsgD family transcriptional regulator
VDARGIAANLVDAATRGEDVARHAADSLLQMMQARSALIVYEHDGTTQLAISGFGPLQAFHEYAQMWRPSDPIYAAMAATQLPIHDGLLYDDATWRRHPMITRFGRTYDLLYDVTAPVVGTTGLIGNVTIMRGARGTRFRDQDLHLISAITTQVSVLIPVAHAHRRRKLLSDLTARELELAELAAEGVTVDDIARRCGRSPNTVKDTLKRVYRKLGVGSRLELSKLLQ